MPIAGHSIELFKTYPDYFMKVISNEAAGDFREERLKKGKHLTSS